MPGRKPSIALSLLILFVFLAGAMPGRAFWGKNTGEEPQETPAAGVSSPTGAGKLFLPLMCERTTLFEQSQGLRINAPFFDGDIRYEEMAIAWFGKIGSADNFADIRTGYNGSELYVDLAIYDRFLWYDTNPSRDTIPDWDAASLYISLDGNQGDAPVAGAYRFDAQLNWGGWEDRENFQAAYQGNGSGWREAPVAFSSNASWRGDAPNNTNDDRGWVAGFHIPFASLGLPGAPALGAVWGMALVLHDRDDAAGAPLAKKTWPVSAAPGQPETWGQLRFGVPVYQAPPSTGGGTVLIRHGENGASVADAAVGGTIGNLCPGNASFIWNEWGNKSFPGAESFNIQNQNDVADWPCFAKVYFEFPLDFVPQGKVIRSAQLVLHIWGGSDPTRARPTYLQVLEIAEHWEEAGLTWNNAPLALQNISGTWVEPSTQNPPDWPGVPYNWDVSLAAARAYQEGSLLRLAVYSSDRYYHSGKYFSASETGDWNKEGRPTLLVEWGNP